LVAVASEQANAVRIALRGRVWRGEPAAPLP
jgi:hypothetical protein